MISQKAVGRISLQESFHICVTLKTTRNCLRQLKIRRSHFHDIPGINLEAARPKRGISPSNYEQLVAAILLHIDRLIGIDVIVSTGE